MREFVRFTISRAACAVLTYAFYLLLLIISSYEVAYGISYALGIVLAYLTTARFVFKEALRPKSAFAFPLVYLVQFLLGYVLIKFGVEVLEIPKAFGLAFSVAVTLPLTFLLSRWAIKL